MTFQSVFLRKKLNLRLYLYILMLDMPAETFEEFPDSEFFLLLNSVFPVDSNFKCTATNTLKSKVHTWIRILTFSSVKCWFVTLMISGYLISSTVKQYFNIKLQSPRQHNKYITNVPNKPSSLFFSIFFFFFFF